MKHKSSPRAGPRTQPVLKEIDEVIRILEEPSQDAEQDNVQGRAELQSALEKLRDLRVDIVLAFGKRSKVDWQLALNVVKFLKEIAEWFSSTQNCNFPWSAVDDYRVDYKVIATS